MGRDDGAKPHDEVLFLAAGLADMVTGGLRGVARRLPGLAELREELRARGELALARSGPGPEAHLELLARRVSERGRHG
jgi:hypothetical protein